MHLHVRCDSTGCTDTDENTAVPICPLVQCRITSFYELHQSIPQLRISFADPAVEKVVLCLSIHTRTYIYSPSCTRFAARRMRCGNGCTSRMPFICGDSSSSPSQTPLSPFFKRHGPSRRVFGKTSGTCSIRSSVFLRIPLIPMDRGLFSFVITWRNGTHSLFPTNKRNDKDRILLLLIMNMDTTEITSEPCVDDLRMIPLSYFHLRIGMIQLMDGNLDTCR